MDTTMKTLITRLLFTARDIRSRKMFTSLRSYCRGSVLDVGGWDFYRTAIRKGISFDTWTILETEERLIPDLTDERIHPSHDSICFRCISDLHDVEFGGSNRRVKQPFGCRAKTYGLTLLQATINRQSDTAIACA